MEALINELKTSISNESYYSALINALIVPDICSALQSDDGQTNGAKYKNWFNKYCANKYNGFVKGDDIYKIRCALLHQGKLNHDNPNYERILFQIPFNGMVFHNNIMNNAINLNLDIFVKDIIDGYYDWKEEHGTDDIVLTNLKHSINIYPNGFAPYIVGVPLIC